MDVGRGAVEGIPVGGVPVGRVGVGDAVPGFGDVCVLVGVGVPVDAQVTEAILIAAAFLPEPALMVTRIATMVVEPSLLMLRMP